MGPLLATTALLLLFHTEFVLTECSPGCISCLDSRCTNCEPSYYLADNNCHPCPDNCLSCTDQTNCTKCKSNKWGTGLSQCFQDCSKECLNGECHDDTGYCLNCEHGKYGLTCQQNCSICQNDNCDLYRCVEGCKSGYFEYQTFNDIFCRKCPKDCKECENGNVCQICNDGFYLNQLYYNGNTYVNCAKCFNENECSNVCFIQGCKLCQLVDNKPRCSDCSEGEIFNGNSCEQIAHKCSQGCSTNCDSYGICLGNCNDGWAGERCTERCNEKCLICSNNDRTICVQCNGNFYSNNCSLLCSKSCKIEEGKQTCTLEDGYCLNGCEQNYWGDTCINSCSENCQDHDCDRSTGTCTRGCKEGYSCDKCGPITTINKKG
ncbi:proprotein convertase subtilisin/kexin type 5-like [Ruditapes philippinarum]|uniref:proprotein convertase subtilisin/kexin type 5-like n=1 Tax=Ruditapes philippinarum TaxID=129788 RepID=UPI00295B77F7|nr:proprotein convertase subtilisin/kexin type 5-like [Ruditapes philippinarum]